MSTIKVALFQTYNTLKNGNKGISVLTILMLILVFLNLLFMPALMEGMQQTLLETLRNSEIGSISINPERGEHVISDVDDVIDDIKAIPNVVEVTPKTFVGAEIVSDEGLLVTTTIQGIDVESHRSVFNVSESIIEGEFLEPDDEHKVVMGVQLAGMDNPDLELYNSSLRTVQVGDQVEIMVNDRSEMYEVKGIYQTYFVLTDSNVIVPERVLHSKNPMLQDTARSLHIKVNDDGNIDTVIEQVEKIYPELVVESWEAQAGMVETMAASLMMVSGILSVIALIVASITILIVTYVDLINKKRQIGIQRAIGISNSAIVLTYVLRAVVYAFIGIIIGFLIFRFVLVPFTEENPLRLPAGFASLQYSEEYTLMIIAVLFAVTVISATLPTLNAVRIRIVDAIWGN